MGCDIHCFVEKKVNRKWKKITGFVSDLYRKDNEYFSGPKFKNSESPIDGRVYSLFAILANVRNGRGFAGCDTGDRVDPISNPKGLPEDCSIEVKKEADSWGSDGHSHSYLTVKELCDYDWDTSIVNRGYVTAEIYDQFKKTGNPYPCCGHVGGLNVMKVSNETILQLSERNPDISFYTKIEWKTSARIEQEDFLTKSLPQLIERCEMNDLESVRIVFWFDN